MAREPISTWFIALVVVRRDDRFLLVHERKDPQPWHLPAGRVEKGETLIAGACRETLEETGIPVRITGLIRLEHSPRRQGARVRVFFLGEPLSDAPPKSKPDNESLKAAWVSLAELENYRLRSDEVRDVLSYVEQGGPIYPLSILQSEGTPFRLP